MSGTLWGSPSENHPENENSVAERMGPIATRTDKLPYLQYITLRGLYSSGMVLDIVVVVSRTEHVVDEEDAAEIDKLLEVMGAVSITELEG
ncbi:hypothetical protein TNCV_4855111 [Trichonephila clavipes]|nr:hypothetical protein TNCV_4855111 [Trichonephila clavipes]